MSPLPVKTKTEILNQQPEADVSSSLQPDNSRIVVDMLYWHIDCKADHDICVTLGIEVRRMLGVNSSL